jgi:predicted RecB family nuclease
MKTKSITTEVAVAYSLCPRKAYLLLCGNDRGNIHEYVQILAEKRSYSKSKYLAKLDQKSTDVDVNSFKSVDFANKSQYLTNALLDNNTVQACCDLLTKVSTYSLLGDYSYEPTIFIGTHKVTKEHRFELYFIAHVLEQVQGKAPTMGFIVDVAGKPHKVKLSESPQVLLTILKPLREWLAKELLEEPPIMLNKHCALCQFRDPCRTKAEQEDNLSLLSGATSKTIRKYEKKGIFTVKQLSYTFKPRKRKKRTKNPPPVIHNLELQALAIREQKMYIQELPKMGEAPIKLFLDIEGIPDQDAYYLFGLIVCQDEVSTYHSFWANTLDDEEKIWHQLLAKVSEYPDAPIYHYTNYELKAFRQLAKRYDTAAEQLSKRLNNLNSYIYGKIYFPAYSNRLKELGGIIGAKWSSPDASGLQSLVWRHQWEKKQDTNFQAILIQYNQDDCQALQSLLSFLLEITRESENSDNIASIDKYKEKRTPVQEEISEQFQEIFKLAHFKYDQNKIIFRQAEKLSEEDRIAKRKENSRNARKGQQKKYLERKRKAQRKIQVPDGEVCPKCNHSPLKRTSVISRRHIIDLILMRSGMRKVVNEYSGFQGYCTECQRNQIPPGIKKYGIKQAYGHGIGAWIVYQRMELRLSYENIVKSIKEQFNENIGPSSCMDLIKRFALYYAETKEIILRNLLQNEFIHADETRANIQGENWYVWVFTDGVNTIYQLHRSREGEIARAFFANYKGVVISDFYAGYDSVECEQQKCWIHLIRDLNNDLKENPFDVELEELIISIRNLIVPIMEVVIKFGLKKRHLRKFEKYVDKFYKDNIENKVFKSDIAQRYQKRFTRYRASLFLFLREDGIPWHNNTAEHAIKHFAKQRDTSGPMFESVAHDYLTLLSIHQTCRNQGKSFLQFLFSEETDLYAFKRYKR